MGLITWIIVIIGVIYIISRISKSSHEQTSRELSHVFLRIDFEYKNITDNPFVKHRVIPYLSKKDYPAKKISVLKEQRKKDLNQWAKKYPEGKFKSQEMYSDEAIENYVWGRILYDLINKQIHKYGEDKSLSFRILNSGSVDNVLLWDNLYKNFSNDDKIDFHLNLDGEDGSLKENLELNGKTVIKKRGEGTYRILIVYFFIKPELGSNEKWEDNVGILGELPYDFLHPQRYEYLSKREESVADLLRLFKLREYKEDHKSDWGGPDELGEHFDIGLPGFTVGTDFVKFWII